MFLNITIKKKPRKGGKKNVMYNIETKNRGFLSLISYLGAGILKC
jgi:hypothetical protein